jgi:hypothetical protein
VPPEEAEDVVVARVVVERVVLGVQAVLDVVVVVVLGVQAVLEVLVEVGVELDDDVEVVLSSDVVELSDVVVTSVLDSDVVVTSLLVLDDVVVTLVVLGVQADDDEELVDVVAAADVVEEALSKLSTLL